MIPPRPDITSFADFQTLLGQVLHLPAAALTPDAYFIADLGLDSLRLIELVLWFHRQGFDSSLDQLAAVQTVGDAYELMLRERAES